ncbi:MAG: hypothetical protein AAF542_04575 [Pseudomonadota bacterium]
MSNQALEFGAQLGVSYESSDNIELLPEENATSDDLRELRLNLVLDGEANVYELDMDYFLIGRDYKDDNLADNNLVSGRALIKWTPLPRRFSWDIMHLRSESTTNTQFEPTPENDETRNVFATGPDLTIALGGSSDLIFGMRYTEIEFERSTESNNNRLGASIEWARELSPVSQLSARIRHQDVDYDIGFEQEFSQITAEYEATLRRSSYSIRLGYNKAETVLGDDVSAPLVRLQGIISIYENPLTLIYTRELTDTSLGLIETTIESETFSLEDGAGQNFEEIDVLLQQNALISYEMDNFCNSCSLRLSAAYDKLDYETLLRDEESFGPNIEFRYAFSPRIDIGLSAQYLERRFPDLEPSREDEQSFYGVDVAYNRWRNIDLAFGVVKQDRTSNLPGFDFEETRFVFSIFWSFGSAAF